MAEFLFQTSRKNIFLREYNVHNNLSEDMNKYEYHVTQSMCHYASYAEEAHLVSGSVLRLDNNSN